MGETLPQNRCQVLAADWKNAIDGGMRSVNLETAEKFGKCLLCLKMIGLFGQTSADSS